MLYIGTLQKNKGIMTWLHLEYEKNPNTEKTPVELSVNSDESKSWTANNFLCSWSEMNYAPVGIKNGLLT